MPDWFDLVLKLAPAVSAAAAAVALAYNAAAFSRDSKQRRLETFIRLVGDLRALESQFYLVYAAKPEEEKQRWDSLFLNALESVSFLVNRKYLKDAAILDFLKPALVDWHRRILQAHVPKWRDPDLYAEYKKLCLKLEPALSADYATRPRT